MKLKKYFLIISVIILLLPISIFIFLNININVNNNKNTKVIVEFNNIFKEQSEELILDIKNNLPKLQLENTDYIGIVNIINNNLLIPVESNCNNGIFNIQSACLYSKDKLIILGTNLKDSFSLFKEYNVDDKVTFTNMFGEKYEYKIKKIKRTDNLDNIYKYDEDLIIVVKNYYDVEYILFICDYLFS